MIIGGDGGDTLFGLAGNDTMDGGFGADTMTGGYGDDTFVVDNVGDVIIEYAGAGTDTVRTTLASYTLGAALENLTFIGNGNFMGLGNAQNNVLTGGAGNDMLNGFGGADTMSGGAGDDVYIVDNAGDVVVEQANEGLDAVRTYLTAYGLSANVENLAFIGTGSFRGVGNTLDNRISGGAGDDTLFGLAGNDTLDGGIGADTMTGGYGDDTFIVDNTGDVIIEYAGAGTDTVRTTLTSYTLAAPLENLNFIGSGNFAGTGNAANNVLTGGVGNDTLDGGGGADIMTGGKGNDTYVIDNPGDVVIELPGEGIDTVRTTLAAYGLGGTLENLIFTGTGLFRGVGNTLDNRITGGPGNDTLFGLAGNDTLDGGAGADTMTGGYGDDTFVVDDIGDVIIEFAGAGTDTVLTSLLNYTLANALDNLTFIGSGHFSGTGNALNNILIGGAGNDTLTGGGGADTITGGAGIDTFVFRSPAESSVTAAGQATITDFSAVLNERIDLSQIDADTNAAGDQAFHFIGSAAFSTASGELRSEMVGGNTLISGDVNGDGQADFAIRLLGVQSLGPGNFVP